MLALAEKQVATLDGAVLSDVHDPAEWLRMVRIGDLCAPQAPSSLAETGIEPQILSDLFLKLAYTAASFTTEWVTNNLCLPVPIVHDLVEQLRRDKLIEVLGDAGRLGYRMAITDRGRERAAQLFAMCGYVGPAPVSLEEYSASLDWQLSQLPEATAQEIAAAIADLVLSDLAVEVAGLAGSSGRSLFLYGPPGNGKTTLAHLLHNVLKGNIWIPHCLSVGSEVIVVFDPETHRRADIDLPQELAIGLDHRWVCCRRPFVIAAGELTLDALELSYGPGRYYDAPMHVKANGGTFVIDDLGRQRVAPQELLNRWLFPLENRADYLTMQNGRKLCVPFRQLLVFSTNLDPNAALDGSFLRRMGYRLRVGNPDPAAYAEIFARYAAARELSVPPGLIEGLLERYRLERRPLRSCEPRDLIERARDICAYRGIPLQLTRELLEFAWTGYFGEQLEMESEGSSFGAQVSA